MKEVLSKETKVVIVWTVQENEKRLWMGNIHI